MSTFGIRIAAFVGGIVSLLVGVGWFATQVENKPYGVHDLERDKWDHIQAGIRQRQQDRAAAAAGQRALPVVEVAERRFDFGTQQPYAVLSHRFRVSNSGAAALQLNLNHTSSRSLTVEVPRDPIPAGEHAEVTVRWNVGEASGAVRETVTLDTNDAFRHTRDLAVSGRVPVILGMTDQKFSAPRVEPDQLVEASTVVYSQCWEDFEISDVVCELENFQWAAEPISPTECAEHGHLAAYRLTLSVSRTTKGRFEQAVKVLVQPPTDGWRPNPDAASGSDDWWTALRNHQPLELASTFYGRVISRIGFYGPDLHVDEGLDMGLISCGTRRDFPLWVRYRGRQVPDRLAVLDIQPPQLEATIEPLASRPGTYRLVVSVPERASQVVFNANQKHGFVQVGDPDHPENNNWFPVMGAILQECHTSGKRE